MKSIKWTFILNLQNVSFTFVIYFTSPHSHLCPLANIGLLSLNIFEFSRILYKWNHTVLIFTCLASFTPNNCLTIHSWCCLHQKLVPFHYWVVFHHFDIIKFVYPFVHLDSLQFWVTSEISMNINACLCRERCFQFSWVNS